LGTLIPNTESLPNRLLVGDEVLDI